MKRKPVPGAIRCPRRGVRIAVPVRRPILRAWPALGRSERFSAAYAPDGTLCWGAVRTVRASNGAAVLQRLWKYRGGLHIGTRRGPRCRGKRIQEETLAPPAHSE